MYVTTTGVYGYNPSSIDTKRDISYEMDSSWIHDLKPVNYFYKTEENSNLESNLQYGLIAEEVEKIPQGKDFLVSYSEEGKAETVNYSRLTTLLLNEVQSLRKELDELKKDK